MNNTAITVMCLSRCWEIQETSGQTSEYAAGNAIEISGNSLFSFIVFGGLGFFQMHLKPFCSLLHYSRKFGKKKNQGKDVLN